MKVFSFFILLFFCLEGRASYRAYRLKVTHFEPSLKRSVTRTVVSTLDHLQYENYHAGYGLLKVELVDTWYCPGDTRRKAICKKTKVKPSVSERELASSPGAAYNKPKRSQIDFNRQPIIP